MNWIEFDLLQSHSSGVGLFILGRSCHKSQEFNTNPADGLHTQQPITVQYCRLHIPTCKFRKLCGPQGHWWTNSSLFQIYFVGECTLTHKLPMLLPFRMTLLTSVTHLLTNPAFWYLASLCIHLCLEYSFCKLRYAFPDAPMSRWEWAAAFLL